MDNKNMAFNPAVIMIEKKPPQNNQNMNNSNSMASSSSNNKPSHTTSESESESESESSDDSSDETKKSVITKPPTVTVESVPLDDDDGELTGFGKLFFVKLKFQKITFFFVKLRPFKTSSQVLEDY